MNMTDFGKSVEFFIEYHELSDEKREELLKEVKNKLRKFFEDEAEEAKMSFKDLMIKEYRVIPSHIEDEKEIEKDWQFYVDEFLTDEAEEILRKKFGYRLVFNF